MISHDLKQIWISMFYQELLYHWLSTWEMSVNFTGSGVGLSHVAQESITGMIT